MRSFVFQCRSLRYAKGEPTGGNAHFEQPGDRKGCASFMQREGMKGIVPQRWFSPPFSSRFSSTPESLYITAMGYMSAVVAPSPDSA